MCFACLAQARTRRASGPTNRGLRYVPLSRRPREEGQGRRSTPQASEESCPSNTTPTNPARTPHASAGGASTTRTRLPGVTAFGPLDPLPLPPTLPARRSRLPLPLPPTLPDLAPRLLLDMDYCSLDAGSVQAEESTVRLDGCSVQAEERATLLDGCTVRAEDRVPSLDACSAPAEERAPALDACSVQPEGSAVLAGCPLGPARGTHGTHGMPARSKQRSARSSQGRAAPRAPRAWSRPPHAFLRAPAALPRPARASLRLPGAFLRRASALLRQGEPTAGAKGSGICVNRPPTSMRHGTPCGTASTSRPRARPRTVSSARSTVLFAREMWPR